MGLKDFLFGKKDKIKQTSRLNRRQKRILRQLSRKLGRLNNRGSTYLRHALEEQGMKHKMRPGRKVKPQKFKPDKIKPEYIKKEHYLDELLMPEKFSAEDLTENLADMQRPALEQWEREVIPSIMERFANSKGSSALNNTLAQSARGLTTDIAAQRAGLINQNRVNAANLTAQDKWNALGMNANLQQNIRGMNANERQNVRGMNLNEKQNVRGMNVNERWNAIGMNNQNRWNAKQYDYNNRWNAANVRQNAFNQLIGMNQMAVNPDNQQGYVQQGNQGFLPAIAQQFGAIGQAYAAGRQPAGAGAGQGAQAAQFAQMMGG